ncbi:MAG: DUF4886 domain-containing protein [Clostridia bacterium]|nr:DUF4886 domain-containing protein [Clostridia bacterium]
MKILAIGNSFSQDATRYLHQIAHTDGVDVTVVNLYIGGCPLYKHYVNMLTDDKKYSLEFNGQSTGFMVSLSEALLSREWDYITVQQVSGQSVDYDTYQPYLNELCSYVRQCAPKAKLVVHQTWFYEKDSMRLCRELGYNAPEEMLADIKAAYTRAAQDIDASLTIPSGELFMALCNAGIDKVHRDTFHASLGLGRYALGLLWYAMLTGKDVSDNAFCDFDEAVTAEEIAIAKKCVKKIAG